LVIPLAVLPREHRHDVDVVIAAAHRYPPHGVVFLAVGRQPRPVHDVAGDAGPQDPAHVATFSEFHDHVDANEYLHRSARCLAAPYLLVDTDVIGCQAGE
jgi:hypothetical protein